MLPFLPPLQPMQVELARGETTHGVAYWDVADASLDERYPDVATGGEGTLSIGPGRTLLIRFGGLDRIVGRRKVARARIVFQQLSGTTTALAAAGRLLVPWAEGPERTLTASLAPPPTDGKPPKPPVWAATWRERRAGKAGWQQAGARGPQDSEPISTAVSTDLNGHLEIDGLAATVQKMADRPLENDGFLFRFDAGADFGSAQAKDGRPRLVLNLEDAPVPTGPDLAVEGIAREGEKFVATVRNVGDATATFGGGWASDGRPVGQPVSGQTLAPGASATFAIGRSGVKDADPKTTPLVFSVAAANDNDPHNDAAEAYEAGAFVDVSLSSEAAAKIGPDPAGWVQSQVRAFNDVYLAQSRFSFAPEGAKPRLSVGHVSVGEPSAGAVRLEAASVGDTSVDNLSLMRAFLAKLALPPAPSGVAASALTPQKSADAYPGLRGFGDTRDDAQLPPSLAFSYEPYPDRLIDQSPLLPSGLLAATDVALLNGVSPSLPRVTAIRAFDLLRNPLADQEIELLSLDGATSLAKFKTTSSGVVVVGKPLLNAWSDTAIARATAHGETAYAYVKGWNLYDSYARGNREIAFLDLRFNLPEVDLDRTVNLASDRIVSVSDDRQAADLAAATDGKLDTSIALGPKKGDWIEIDLGRDRTIGEFRLAGDLWQRFHVVGYGTGQRPDDASPLAVEASWSWARDNRGSGGWVEYRTPSVRVRYIRVVADEDGKGSLSDIWITPAKVSP